MKYDEKARLREQINTLVSELGNEQLGIRRLAMVQLSILGSQAVPYLGALLIENMQRLKDLPVPYAAEVSPRSSVIEGLTKVLGAIADPGAVPYLAKVLPSLEAVEALAKIGDREALSLVIRTLPQWYVQSKKRSGVDEQTPAKGSFAARVFSYFGPEGVSAMAEALEATNERELYRVACEIFDEIGDQSVVAPLLKCLQQDDVEIKVRALGALQRLKAKIPKTQLMDELDFAYSESRPEYSTYGWTRLQEALLQVTDTELLVEFLLNRGWKLKTSFPKDLLEYYISLDGSRAMPILLETLEKGSQAQQEVAANVIAKIKTPEKKRPERQFY